MRFHVITFGCQMNVGDSDWLSRSLLALGWERVPAAEADVVVVNTCSVRKKPEEKVYSLLGRLRDMMQGRPGTFVAVGGCLAQQVGADFFGRFPHVRLVFGTDATASVPQALARLAAEPRLRLSLLDFSEEYAPRERPDLAGGGQVVPDQAFVTIMQGCDNFCAYCIVPHVRGRQKSRAAADVLAECREWLGAGASELTLLGQNVNSYGQDAAGDGTSFAELLYRVAELPGLRRLRFTTSHPKDIAPEVIRAFAELPVLAPHLHLPLQSGSDRILALMGRKYDRARYLEIVAALREARPELTLSTDLIVGFPTETEEEFGETLSVVEEVGFESSFFFLYNDRPGVRSVKIEPKVSEAVKTRRLLELQALQDGLTEKAYAALVGTETEIMYVGRSRVDRDAEGSALAEGLTSWAGRDAWGRVVNVAVSGDADLTGAFARVKIEKAKKHSLTATQLGATWSK
ncbi:(Dimethylallyl)adenosine tRNA methylthiotransferase miaB [Desulfovibrio sp. X2]|uniref:tRNA (N6-isopentenyl adenosine(37)-C2)-methylthiotransferase MiaB n=1 Tax=Desulfovibrio sp. X2 TaxID=941449 RepID=UPI000358756D|nr:tRNA (N6-isopentenyl adenosine(37)-C2)-methylthiotransferase MiaB [Desulfovibrio sp. X2]EPR37035.1 (Dimethylallyl)adenosine tRNA methylthiotransferase miaB [Desulfovibrio sp. X2]